MGTWNFADIWETAADELADAPCLIHGDDRRSWGEVDRRADAGCVVFHGSFADTIEAIREQLPEVKVWLWVDDGSGPCPDWATPYEDAATSGAGRVSPERGRTGATCSCCTPATPPACPRAPCGARATSR